MRNITENDSKINLSENAQMILQELISKFIEDGEVHIIDQEEPDSIILNIKTSNPGILIGRHGHTLDAIQYIVNIIINKKIEESERKKIIVDIEGYRERRKDIVSKYACEKADVVKRTGKKIALCSMSAVERRMVHLVLQEDPLVITYSEGTEPFRRVIIALKESKNNTEDK